MKLLLTSLMICLLGTAAHSDGLRWAESAYGRSANLLPPAGTRAGFHLLAPSETGVTFTNVLTDAKASENQIRLNGSGVAIGDVNGDGRPDIYLCGLESPNALFLNLG